MADRPILEIPVDDTQFREFAALFDKYRENLARLPEAWRGVDKASQSSFERVAAAMMAQQELASRAARAERKGKNAVSASALIWTGIERTTRRTAGNIGDITKAMLKWTTLTGVFTGLVGGGGLLFGMDRLAGFAYGAQRSAKGLNITQAQQRALGVNYGQFFDVNSALENIANAKYSYAGRVAFAQMGIGDYQQRDPAQLALETADRARNIWRGLGEGDRTSEMAGARGLSAFFSMDDLRRMAATPDAQWRATKGSYGDDARAYGLDPGTMEKWNLFRIQLTRAGNSIETTFIKGLVPLTEPLGHLSKAFTDLVDTLLSGPELKKWIEDAATGLEEFAKFTSTPQFKADVTEFVQNVGVLAKGIVAGVTWIADKIGWLLPDKEGKDKKENAGFSGLKPGNLIRDNSAGAMAGAAAGAVVAGPIGAVVGGIGGTLAEANAKAVNNQVKQTGGFYQDDLGNSVYLGPQSPDTNAPDKSAIKTSAPSHSWLHDVSPIGTANAATEDGIPKRREAMATAGMPAPDGNWHAPRNNPGNIRHWAGMPERRGFAVFPNEKTGLRAMGTLLRKYEDRDHRDTIAKIISKWAPPSENDTAGYIRNVAKRTGFSPNQHLDLRDNATLAKLISAMTKQENSKSDYTPERVVANLDAGDQTKLQRDLARLRQDTPSRTAVADNRAASPPQPQRQLQTPQLGTRIQIDNNTGGSAIISTSQLAQ